SSLGIQSVLQNRTNDPSGTTVDIRMVVPVTPATADLTTSWSASAGNILTATLQPDNRTVRLVMDTLVVPGDVTFGATAGGVEDLLGNSFALPVVGQILVADILTAPTATFAGVTIAGADNDQLVATFNDMMIQAEVETVGNWSLEAPVGVSFDLTNATISYDTGSQMATVSLGATVPGIVGDANNLQTSDALQLTFSGIRNFSGVAEAGAALSGTASGDNTPPTIDSVWADGVAEAVNVRFSEPVKAVIFADLYSGGIDSGARFQLTDADGVAAIAATGTITVTGDPVDGETMTFDDGAGATDIYEWDDDVTVTGGNISVTITTGDNNAMATALQAAIAGSGTAGITAVDAAPAVTLTNNLAGTAGNVGILGAPTSVTIAGMASGTDVTSNLATLEAANFAFTADQTGVTVDYDVVPTDGADTLEIYGVQDLAGNQTFAVQTQAIVAEDATPPAIDAGATSVLVTEGERNDKVLVTFNQAMSPFNLTNPANYSAAPLDLTGATFTIESSTEVGIDFTSEAAANAQFGTAYTVTIVQNAGTPMYTEQGIVLGSDDAQVLAGSGDSTAIATAAVYVGPVGAPDTCILVFPEATNTAGSTVLTNYNILGVNPTAIVQMTPRAYELTFPTQPAPADSLVVEVAAATDLGGTPAAGQANYALTGVDATAPTATFTATAVSGVGFDTFAVTFDESMDQTTALDAANYSYTVGGTLVSMTGATFSYDSTNFRVNVALAATQNLMTGAATTLVMSNVTDISGNALTVQPVDGTVAGDSLAPGFAVSDPAFVNYIADATGATFDVLFYEAVDTTFVETAGNWSTSDGTSVVSATQISPTTVRIVLDGQIGSSATFGLTAVPDLAGNTSGAITANPAE
ncbi:MAG: hypothetical protein ACI89E_000757, partial [Planctomycetota bacterium]